MTILTYLLTPWYWVILEKLTGLQLVKKFPSFRGTRRFITALTSVRHLSLSWASQSSPYTQKPPPGDPSEYYPHTYALVSPVVSFPPFSPPRTYTAPSNHPYAPYAQPISFFSILSLAQYWVRSTNHLVPRNAISSIPPYLVPPRSKYICQIYTQIFVFWAKTKKPLKQCKCNLDDNDKNSC